MQRTRAGHTLWGDQLGPGLSSFYESPCPEVMTGAGGVAAAGQCDLCNVNSIKVERRFRSQAVTVVCSAPACCGTLSCNPSPCTTQPLPLLVFDNLNIDVHPNRVPNRAFFLLKAVYVFIHPLLTLQTISQFHSQISCKCATSVTLMSILSNTTWLPYWIILCIPRLQLPQYCH